MTDEIMALREVAEFMKINERTICRLVADERIPTLEIGGTWRFRRADFGTWITCRTDGEKEEWLPTPEEIVGLTDYNEWLSQICDRTRETD